MNKNTRVPNLDAARKSYGEPNYERGKKFQTHPDKPMDYSPAYVVSNENLRYTTGLTRDMGRKVLTVAGSGEQPLFYTLNGAKKITTFDISLPAFIITEIKNQAIKSGMPYEQYVQLLTDLYSAPSASQVNGMSDILPKISTHSAYFVRGMDGYRIFGNGLAPKYYAKEMISRDEYSTLQKKLPDHFDFIWSNVASLHTHLNDEYDVINLSNIFEWYPNLIQPTLQNLHDYIRPGGYILVQTGNIIAISRNTKEYEKASENLKEWAKIDPITSNTRVVKLQRIR